MSEKNRQMAMAIADGETGAELASSNSGAGWEVYAYRKIRRYLNKHPTMHVDDLWEAGLEEPPQGNGRALGKVIKRLAAEGYIRKQWAGDCYLARSSIRSHGQGKPVWQSMLFSPEPAPR